MSAQINRTQSARNPPCPSPPIPRTARTMHDRLFLSGRTAAIDASYCSLAQLEKKCTIPYAISILLSDHRTLASEMTVSDFLKFPPGLMSVRPGNSRDAGKSRSAPDREPKAVAMVSYLGTYKHVKKRDRS